MTIPPKVLNLIERFEQNLADYRSGRYNETQARHECRHVDAQRSQSADDAAGNPGATPAQFLGVVGMVVTAGMNHQRPSLEVVYFQARCQYGIVCPAATIHVNGGEIP